MEVAIAPSLKYHRPTALANPENWNYLPSDVPYGGTNRGGNQQNAHPTVKPIKLMSWLAMLGAMIDEVVLDPFVGSGTTAIACVLTGRQYIGMEINKEYFEIAMRRLTHFKQKIKPNQDVLEGL
jgi:DNA modification methylase